MTPQDYIAAVKACPRVACVERIYGERKLIQGYAIRREDDCATLIPDFKLSEKVWTTWYAKHSLAANHLAGDRAFAGSCFFGEIPSEEDLRAYFISKHGNPKGLLNWLFPKRVLNSAAMEWVEEQARKRRAEESAAIIAAHQVELRKRSYWESLDGYAFDRATAEILSKHQFNAIVTRGSGDGGIDIEVTRNSLKGVVQCKAHAKSVGPHVVRDLYGVIHDCGADFGIIVSRGGFSRGANEFATGKPIHFLDISDLIAMQESRDVLASAFSRKDA